MSMGRILGVATVSAFAVAAFQLTPGYAMRLAKARTGWNQHWERKRRAAENADDEHGAAVAASMRDMIVCPWCLTPWVAGPLYFAVSREPLRARLAGAMVAASAAAFIRHFADVF